MIPPTLRERVKQFLEAIDARTHLDDTFYAVDYIRGDGQCGSLKADVLALLDATPGEGRETPKLRTARESLGTMESIGPQMPEAHAHPAVETQHLLSVDEEREILAAVERLRSERDEAIHEAEILQNQIDNHYIPRVVTTESRYDQVTGQLGQKLGDERKKRVEAEAALTTAQQTIQQLKSKVTQLEVELDIYHEYT